MRLDDNFPDVRRSALWNDAAGFWERGEPLSRGYDTAHYEVCVQWRILGYVKRESTPDPGVTAGTR